MKFLEIEKLIEKITDEIYRKIKEEISESSINVESFGKGECRYKTGENSNFSNLIDHTLLKQDATQDQIKNLCKEALEYKFASVCVNPSYVPLAAELLKNSSVKVCCVIGFPLGATTTKTKVFETKEVIENGAQEVDMVINVGALKSGNWDYVRNDIEAVVIAADSRALIKVILETCLLNDDEKVKACLICKEVGVDFVKTSTGFSSGGATVEDVKLMRKLVGECVGVKASGGVKDYASASAMIEAGATRLGTSSGIAIVKNMSQAIELNSKKSIY